MKKITIQHVYKHFPNWTSKDAYFSDTYANIFFMPDFIVATNVNQIIMVNIPNINPHIEDIEGKNVDITDKTREIFNENGKKFLKVFPSNEDVIWQAQLENCYFEQILSTLKAMKSFTNTKLQRQGVLYYKDSQLAFFSHKNLISGIGFLTDDLIICKDTIFNWAITVKYEFLINSFIFLQELETEVATISLFRTNTGHPFCGIQSENVKMLTTGATGIVKDEIEEEFKRKTNISLTSIPKIWDLL